MILLKKNVMFSACELKLGNGWASQKDNDPKHTSKSTEAFLRNGFWKVPEWPSQSVDLNSSRNIWI